MPRLDVLLAHNLAQSRSAIAQLLRSGRVTDTHGTPLGDGRLAIASSPAALQRVLVDGVAVTLRERMDLMQHKPVGTVTALTDARHPTAYQLLGDAPLHAHLRAVGRLDLDSSGLLLWTTDGALLHRMTHPRYAVERTYHVALGGPWRTPDDDLVLSDGHRPNIVELRPCDASQMHPGLAKVDGVRAFATVTLTSGRFAEVRRIFVELGSLVLALCRVRFGSLELPTSLVPGQWQEVDPQAWNAR